MERIIKEAFEKNLIDGVLVLAKTSEGFNYKLISKVDDIKDISPFHPVMKINGARVAVAITKDNEANKKFLFILKPCEVRAVIELKKLNQVDIENSIFVSFICPGVFNYKKGNDFEDTNSFIKEFKEGNLNENLRPLCNVCEYFCGEGSDILYDIFTEKFISLTEKGENFLKSIGFDFENRFNSNDVLEKIKSKKEENLKKLLEEYSKDFNLINFFDKCIKCGNCQEVCPICYCRQCFFNSDSFKYYPDSIKRKLNQKKALRLPTDKILFHLGRVSHMALSCVGCGMCQDACPMDIKVGEFFRYMGKNLQDTFNYTPGINIDEPLPLLTFKENEFTEFED